MRLDRVDYPFSEEYAYAYVLTYKDNRRHVCLVDSTMTKRKSISYARYLMCVKEGRILGPNEEVDHIDNDKTNDSIDNLQILTPEQNRAKYAELIKAGHGTSAMYHKGCRCDKCKAYHKQCMDRHVQSHMVEDVCLFCGRLYKHYIHKHKKFCSRKCYGAYLSANA